MFQGEKSKDLLRTVKIFRRMAAVLMALDSIFNLDKGYTGMYNVFLF